MRKTALTALISCIIALFWVTGIQAEIYDPDPDFWIEKFKGGGPGQPGNVLQAVGEGFTLNNAVLDSVVLSGVDEYTSTYVNGKLVLTNGPWKPLLKELKTGVLKCSDVTAVNVSAFDNATGVLKFELTLTGTFDKTDITFKAVATYKGTPEVHIDENGIPIYQRDSAANAETFDVTIEITVPAPAAPGKHSVTKTTWAKAKTK